MSSAYSDYAHLGNGHSKANGGGTTADYAATSRESTPDSLSRSVNTFCCWSCCWLLLQSMALALFFKADYTFVSVCRLLLLFHTELSFNHFFVSFQANFPHQH